MDEVINTSFYVGKNNNYCFRFACNMINNNIIEDDSINFLLTDYYGNLVIERCEIILWPR